MIRSIFSKILLSHIGIILLSTITLTLFMSYLVRSNAVDTKRHDLLFKGQAVVELLTPNLLAGNIPTNEALDRISELAGGRIWLINEKGTVLAGRPPNNWSRRFQEDRQEYIDLFTDSPHSWIRPAYRRDPSIVVTFAIPEAPTPIVIFLDAPIVGVNKTVSSLERTLLYSLLASIITAILAGFLIARSLTKPIANISQAAKNFADGNYNSRTTAIGNNEIGGLGRTFNTMADSLAEIEQNRRNFLANVSHELKTPVTSIQALSETILDGLAPKPEQQQRYIATILQESQRLDRLISDLLDLSQLEADELSILCEKLDLQTWLVTEATKIETLLNPKHLTLETDIPEQLPYVWCDPIRLEQVFTNLLTNAIRYSPENSTITIHLSVTKHQVAISVIDQGPGISPDDVPYIWDRFYRADKSRARTYGGTGLGLAITKKLVHAMQGEISVDSHVGKGSTFTFTLPIIK
ncbi:sensor histidine kinase [Pelosinus fermentans]|jgi:signal transduction histidine kinase|uniref:histidine kinase n=2 Tax=Pelosinus TaxID=365348 RepID=I8RLT9_9FIRM|nr:HAMP domain-containing sensor histidine kinase [Pelosinus fermentans]EIW19640.1 ATP-binding region ATPase domain protein [Pelosinus fermentans B4]EIW24617.1 integral membrane sensor signal transduction histidine kinase [Pelosinus fermentans A11]OAM95918.1 integral membrane sensor signal transduction histidine kinase [Pelosinus fermentans DSM 17108]SDR34340.1 HAMP domain-containing protein [Pelosinus fermentans]